MGVDPATDRMPSIEFGFPEEPIGLGSEKDGSTAVSAKRNWRTVPRNPVLIHGRAVSQLHEANLR